MIRIIAGIVVVILAFLIGRILIQGLPHISWKFLTTSSKAFTSGGGIGIQLFNSFYLLILTLIISFPISLGAGIFLAEYAPKNALTNVIRMAIEILSSLPSVVVGLFGFLLFVVQFKLGFSILSKWHTVIKVILPEAIPGIVTGIVLCAGRIFGEAAALIYTAGQSATSVDFTKWNPFDASSPLNLFRPAETLAVHIWKINSEGIMPDAEQISAGASAVLIIAVLIFNLSARFLGQKLYQHLTAAKQG